MSNEWILFLRPIYMLWRREECLVKTLMTQTSAHTATRHQVSDKSKAAEVWKFSSVFSPFRHELIDWRRALPTMNNELYFNDTDFIIPVISWVRSEKHCFTSTVYICTPLFLFRSSSSNTSCTSAELAVMGSFGFPWKLPLLIIWLSAATSSPPFCIFYLTYFPPLLMSRERRREGRGQKQTLSLPSGEKASYFFPWGCNQKQKGWGYY